MDGIISGFESEFESGSWRTNGFCCTLVSFYAMSSILLPSASCFTYVFPVPVLLLPCPILNWAFEFQNFVCCAVPCPASIFLTCPCSHYHSCSCLYSYPCSSPGLMKQLSGLRSYFYLDLDVSFFPILICTPVSPVDACNTGVMVVCDGGYLIFFSFFCFSFRVSKMGWFFFVLSYLLNYVCHTYSTLVNLVVVLVS